MPHVEIVVAESDEFPRYELRLRDGSFQFMDRRLIQLEARKDAGMSRIFFGRFVIDHEDALPRSMQPEDREKIAGILYEALPTQPGD